MGGFDDWIGHAVFELSGGQASLRADMGEALSDEEQDAVLTPLVVRQLDDRTILVSRNRIARYVRGRSRTSMFRLVAAIPGKLHTWREIRTAIAAFENAGRTPDEWRLPPEVDSLRRTGVRLRTALVEFGAYWRQDGKGATWDPPGHVAVTDM